MGDNFTVAWIVIPWDLNWSLSLRLHCQYCMFPHLSALTCGVFNLLVWDVFWARKICTGILLLLHMISFTIFMILQCVRNIRRNNLAMSHYCSSFCLCARHHHWHTVLFDSDCTFEIKSWQFIWKPIVLFYLFIYVFILIWNVLFYNTNTRIYEVCA